MKRPVCTESLQIGMRRARLDSATDANNQDQRFTSANLALGKGEKLRLIETLWTNDAENSKALDKSIRIIRSVRDLRVEFWEVCRLE